VNERPVDVEQVLTCPAASKEWVIQPKPEPKPGCKPKTDLTVKDDSKVRAFMSLDEHAIQLGSIVVSVMKPDPAFAGKLPTTSVMEN